MNVQVNPEILRWARATAGLELDEAARLLGFQDRTRRTAVQRLRALEKGDEAPSLSVLDKMSVRYRRPTIVFYLPSPPVDEEPAARFRSAPKDLMPADEGRLNAFVRTIRGRQNLLREALEDYGDFERVNWVGSATADDGRKAIATRIDEILGLDLTEFRAQTSAEASFGVLRKRAEAAGVFVLLQGDFGSWQSALEIELFRGISLADPVAPFVVINPQDAPSAWSFTLLHELTHLVLGQSEFADFRSNDRLEQLCNDVAGDLLLPERDIRELSALRGLEIEALADAIPRFARQWRVSSSMVAYRAARLRYIRGADLNPLLRIFESRWRDARNARKARERQSDAGPSLHVVRGHRLGNALIERTRELWRTGELTTTRAGMVLGIRAISVHALLEPWRR